MTREEGVDKAPGDGGGGQHSKQNQGEHQAPGRAFVARWGCLIGWIFMNLGHRSVYGEQLPQKVSRRTMAQTGQYQFPGLQQH
jgi:hypothetical protein